MNWSQWLQQTLQGRVSANQMRTLTPVIPDDAVHVHNDQGERLTLFSGNDYLGLSHHPDVILASHTEGLGPRGSALVCGYTTRHQALEHALARLKQKEAALLFPTGFAANLAVLGALAGPDVLVFSDQLNHASIIDGLGLAKRRGAQVRIYPHLDPHALSSMMHAVDKSTKRMVVVTDSVFSMDGDLAPLVELGALCQEHDAIFVVDEAHATLVYGDQGGGLANHLGCEDLVHLSVGTLSKAVGAQGGFVATSQAWRSFLVNFGRTQIYSTSLPLPIIEAALCAVTLPTQNLREILWNHIHKVSRRLRLPPLGPIFPVILGDETLTLDAAHTLQKEWGIHCVAIRPPTVPKGTSRLRVTLSAAHSDQEVEMLCQALAQITS